MDRVGGKLFKFWGSSTHLRPAGGAGVPWDVKFWGHVTGSRPAGVKFWGHCTDPFSKWEGSDPQTSSVSEMALQVGAFCEN